MTTQNGNRPDKDTYDVIVIGGGTAGSSCAHLLNDADLKVALVERDKLGGTCLNYGCDPTKTALYAAKVLYEAQNGAQYGLRIEHAALDWRLLQRHIAAVLDEMRGGTAEESREKMRDSGIDLIKAEASFVSAHEVRVHGRVLSADHIVIATGAETDVPPISGLLASGYLTNRNVFQLPEQPKRLAIVGAGPVGVEFAQFFARIGTAVTLIEGMAHILPQDDPTLTEALADILRAEGVEIKTNAKVTAVGIDPSGYGKTLTLTHEGGYEEICQVDDLLLAVGRQKAVAALNLPEAGVDLTEDGRIATDEALRTSVPHIWAAGDVGSTQPFTHVAWRQGEHIARNIVAGETRPWAREVVPHVTYTEPELAHVGQTRAELDDAEVAYEVLTVPLGQVARAIAMGQDHGRVQLLVGTDGHILGGDVLAVHGGDLLGPILLAMQAKVPVATLADTIWPYPTLSTALGKTARQWAV